MSEELPRDLTKKPLVEAIFELRWKLETTGDPAGGRDPGFKILLGRYFDLVRSRYPTLVDLAATQVPEDLVPHAVRHQFRSGPEAWPLLQLGPGILTVNETAGYSWATFKPRLHDAISALFKSYPADLHSFTPTQVVLRYLNALPVDPRETPLIAFLRDKLHTQITLAPALGETVQDLDSPVGMNLSLLVPMKGPAGVCGMSFVTGKSLDRPALIWQLEAQARDADTPQDAQGLSQWLEEAHSVIEKWFFTLSAGELLNGFKGVS